MYEDEKKLFLRIHGRPLNLENPQSFSEKIVYKKLFDRNPLLVLTADKYRIRQYIRDRIGWEADNHLIPLLYVTDNPETIPFDKLPKQYIIKPNNGAGRWIVAEENRGSINYEINYTCKKGINLSNKEMIGHCQDWFKSVHGSQWYEWAYGEIKPLVIVEELLYENGYIPFSYKFCMFDGKCKMIYVLNRHDININHYSQNWDKLGVTRKGHPLGDWQSKPKALNKMIEFAEKLSFGFDFVRVDFYLVNDYIYFGEMTHYPGSGHGVFEPKEYDFELGKYWEIKKEGL